MKLKIKRNTTGRNQKPSWTFTFNDTVKIKVMYRPDNQDKTTPPFLREAHWHTRFYRNGNFVAATRSYHWSPALKDLRLAVAKRENPEMAKALSRLKGDKIIVTFGGTEALGNTGLYLVDFGQGEFRSSPTACIK